jgi:hypothetical protein
MKSIQLAEKMLQDKINEYETTTNGTAPWPKLIERAWLKQLLELIRANKVIK